VILEEAERLRRTLAVFKGKEKKLPLLTSYRGKLHPAGGTVSEDAQYVTLVNLVAEWQISESTIRRLIDKHRIPIWKKPGDRHSYVLAEDVERMRQPIIRVDRFAFEGEE
jgi:hypothetical protein